MDLGMGRNIRTRGGGTTRNHGYQIEREEPGSNPAKNYSLPIRNTKTWNILPTEVVEADSVNVFKERLTDT
jgi:hypothetical protein